MAPRINSSGIRRNAVLALALVASAFAQTPREAVQRGIQNNALIGTTSGALNVSAVASGTLNTAVSAIGSTPTTLVVSGPLTLSGSVTIPVTTRLSITQAGSITTTGYTLTINGHLEAGQYQIFSGSGTVTFGRGAVNYTDPCWWGAKGDDTSFAASYDNSTYIQAALNAAYVIGVPTIIPEGRYKFGTTLTLCSNAFPGPAELRGAMQVSRFGSWESVGTSSKGTELRYTGSTNAIVTGQARSITIRNIVLVGPGKATAGSIGIGVTGGNSGCLIEDTRIMAFETAIKTGYDIDGNADVNSFVRLDIGQCYNGIWISKSQNYMNEIVACNLMTRVGVRSDGPHFDVYGGIWGCQYVSVNTESVWSTTVASHSGQNITLTDGSHLAAGQFMVIQSNATLIGGVTRPPYNNPLGVVSSVAGNIATLDGSSYTAEVQNGATVIYGSPSVVFWVGAGGANIIGTQVESAPDINSPTTYYNPMLLYTTSVGPVVIDGIYYNQAANSDIAYNKLFPIVALLGSGQVTIQNSAITHTYPKVSNQVGSLTLKLRNNRWDAQPIIIGNSGYPSNDFATITENERFSHNWGQPTGATDIGRYQKTSMTGIQPVNAPQGLNRVEYYDGSTKPARGVAGEFVEATGKNALSFAGWKQSYNDDENSELHVKSLTATGSITSGSAVLTVSSVAELVPYMSLIVAGASGGSGNLTKRIEFIDGSTNTVYLSGVAATTVTGAALSATAPVFRKAGMVFLEGSTTWDPGNLSTLTGETKSLTVTGAALGDFVIVSSPYDMQDTVATGYVQADNTVEIRLFNATSGSVDLGSGTWRVRVVKQ